jgi:hypothetical protein
VLRRGHRQLQNGGNLTREQARKQNDLSVGELKRIVMGVKLIVVKLPKLSYLSFRFAGWVKEVKSGLVFHRFLEGEFGARKQTNRNIGLSNSRKTSGNRSAELSRYQLIADFCRSGRNKIQAIVAHE